jgi:hypothetical protein
MTPEVYRRIPSVTELTIRPREEECTLVLDLVRVGDAASMLPL